MQQRKKSLILAHLIHLLTNNLSSVLKQIILAVAIVVATVTARGQTPVIDSLKRLLPSVSAEEKVKLLIDIGAKMRSFDPPKARRYAEQALAIAQKLGNGKLIGDSYNSLGSTALLGGEYRQAIEDYTNAVKIREEIGDTLGLANTFNNMGIVYRRQGEYDKALDYYIQSLRKKEMLGNKEDLAASLNNIGGLYYFQKSYDKAEDYYEQALQLARELNDDEGMAAGYNNMALIYFEQEDYVKSMQYNQLALQVRERNNDVLGMATTHNNIGRIYEVNNDLEEAQKSYFKSLELYNKTGDNAGISNTLYNIGNLFLTKNNYRKAQSYLAESIQLSRITGNRPQLRDAYRGMSKCLYELGHYKEAFAYQEDFIALNDTIFNQENIEQMAEMEARYESDKKVREIELLKKENEIDTLEQKAEIERAKIMRNTMAAGIGGSLVILLLLFNRYRVKQKANVQLGQQKMQIELANMQLAQKNTEITDSIKYAKHIQEAILPPHEEMKKLLPDSFVLYKPKDIVSGDFYWVEQWGNHTLVAAVDCTGHGVPGAFMSIVGYNLLSQAVNNLGLTRPSLILNALNKGVTSMLHQKHETSANKDGMDIALCSIDRKNNVLEFAGAYNSMYLVREGKLTEIKGDKFPVGMFVDEGSKLFNNHEIILQPGDTIYIFSDGYADQFGGEKGKKFKYKQFQELLLSIQSRSMDKQKQVLDETIERWRGNLEQVDDILVIGFRV